MLTIIFLGALSVELNQTGSASLLSIPTDKAKCFDTVPTLQSCEPSRSVKLKVDSHGNQVVSECRPRHTMSYSRDAGWSSISVVNESVFATPSPTIPIRNPVFQLCDDAVSCPKFYYQVRPHQTKEAMRISYSSDPKLTKGMAWRGHLACVDDRLHTYGLKERRYLVQNDPSGFCLNHGYPEAIKIFPFMVDAAFPIEESCDVTYIHTLDITATRDSMQEEL